MNPFEGYKISSPFGWRESPTSSKRSQEFHTGIDLVKPYQSPIYTFASGEVIHAQEGITGRGFGDYGIVVAVSDHNTGHLHCYAHLDSAVVKVGQQVERGQMIGRLGTTGLSTGPHLHYEIRKTSLPQYGWIADRENNCFEPTQYLKNMYESESAGASFKDIPKDHWCNPHIELLKGLGILEGYSDNTFRGDNPITRYEFAAALANFHNALRK